jgi:hypothetical protein
MVSAMQNINPDQALKKSRAMAMPKRMLVSFSRRRQQRLLAALLFAQRAGPHPDQQRQHRS